MRLLKITAVVGCGLMTNDVKSESIDELPIIPVIVELWSVVDWVQIVNEDVSVDTTTDYQNCSY